MDRFGTCSNCEQNFDGGDILENVNKLGALAHHSFEAKQTFAEKGYGYLKENKKHFSNLITLELEYGLFLQCPRCGTIWDANTDEEFKNISKLYEKYDNNSEEFSGTIEE